MTFSFSEFQEKKSFSVVLMLFYTKQDRMKNNGDPGEKNQCCIRPLGHKMFCFCCFAVDSSSKCFNEQSS